MGESEKGLHRNYGYKGIMATRELWLQGNYGYRGIIEVLKSTRRGIMYLNIMEGIENG
tara:strand:+ start:308 stop:481 length:174 start_codon:yes stop_codon:yes gene_type:complete